LEFAIHRPPPTPNFNVDNVLSLLQLAAHPIDDPTEFSKLGLDGS
jgi:hypothetical protein